MVDMKGLRAVRYHRVSTTEQAESGAGMDAQREATSIVCKHNSWNVVSVFEDNGASGKTIHRPGLSAALEQLASRQADVLVVAKLDRLSRSVLDFTSMMYRAEKEGWHLAIHDIRLDTSSVNGRMVLNIMATLAQWEREIIAQRTREALQAKKASGVKLGRPGTSLDVKQRIRGLRASGNTYQAIADQLNVERVPTGHGASQWQTSSVRKIAGDVTKPKK